jgi:hypothetical protein
MEQTHPLTLFDIQDLDAAAGEIADEVAGVASILEKAAEVELALDSDDEDDLVVEMVPEESAAVVKDAEAVANDVPAGAEFVVVTEDEADPEDTDAVVVTEDEADPEDTDAVVVTEDSVMWTRKRDDDTVTTTLMQRIGGDEDRGLARNPQNRMRHVIVTGSQDWVNGMAVLDTLDSELSRSPFGLVVICGNDSNVDVIAQQWAERARSSGAEVFVLVHNEPRISTQQRVDQMMSWGAGVCHVFATPGSSWNSHLSARCLEAGVLVLGHANEARARRRVRPTVVAVDVQKPGYDALVAAAAVDQYPRTRVAV